MIKEIPNRPNHRIKGYEVYNILGPDFRSHSCYLPIYERIVDLGTIVTTSTTPYYLISDTEGINAMGVKETIKDYKPASDQQKGEFFIKLEENGYMINDKGQFVSKPVVYWRPLYKPKTGFMPIQCCPTDNNYDMYRAWDEVFETKEECISWCNHINKTLQRNYVELS